MNTENVVERMDGMCDKDDDDYDYDYDYDNEPKRNEGKKDPPRTRNSFFLSVPALIVEMSPHAALFIFSHSCLMLVINMRSQNAFHIFFRKT